jgi:MFS superfamily sulfate permease-like transporter
VVGAVVITLVLVLFPSLMQYVPQPTLGAIVIAAALSLADIRGTRRLWQQQRVECVLSIVALLGVALLGVLPGILIAVALSILNVFRRVWWPHQAELGRVEGIDGLHDTASYPDAELLPGLVVYRFDAPLIFANSRIFGDEIRAIAENRPGLKWIVIAAEPVTDVDTTASDMLQALDIWLNERGISLIFAELKDPVREKIERYELTRTIDPDHFFPTVDAAVERYMHETDATWKAPKDGVSAEPDSAAEPARTIHDQSSKQDQ